jgi:hypothetical protein
MISLFSGGSFCQGVSVMNSKVKVIIFTLVAVFAFTMITCNKSGGGSSGKSLNSAEDLKAYLDKQPANTPDKPIKVTISANDQMLPNIVRAINSAGKYVSLNFSGDALTAIPEWAFCDQSTKEGCALLVAITIPNRVFSIGEYAFLNCTNLSSITIPNSVGQIRACAFLNCKNLTSITFPNRQIVIFESAFSNCTNLTSVTFEGEQTVVVMGDPYPGIDLHGKYWAGGPGTYTRPSGGDTWTKQ